MCGKCDQAVWDVTIVRILLSGVADDAAIGCQQE